VEPGHTVAIGCQTGARKTTLVKLINRIYDTSGGRVLVDGVPVRSLPLEMKIAQQLAALVTVFEAIPELEFDQAANLRAEAGHDRLLHDAGMDAEPNPELGFDQEIRVVIRRCRDGTCGGAWIGVDQALAWCGEWCGLPNPDYRQCAFFACYAYNIVENRTKAVFDLKFMVGWGQHKVVFDESGFRAYCVGVDCALNFLSVGEPDEIVAVILEMETRLKCTEQPAPNDEALQRRFWEIFVKTAPDRHAHGSIRLRIGASFLRQHEAWLESPPLAGLPQPLGSHASPPVTGTLT